jgi:predicted amidohydrolase YtcJ
MSCKDQAMQAYNNMNARASADIIFTGERVHTVNASNDIVEAIAVSGRRILAVGSTADIRALAVAGITDQTLDPTGSRNLG